MAAAAAVARAVNARRVSEVNRYEAAAAELGPPVRTRSEAWRIPPFCRAPPLLTCSSHLAPARMPARTPSWLWRSPSSAHGACSSPHTIKTVALRAFCSPTGFGNRGKGNGRGAWRRALTPCSIFYFRVLPFAAIKVCHHPKVLFRAASAPLPMYPD